MDLYRYTSETPYTESHNASVGEFLFFLDKEKLSKHTRHKNHKYNISSNDVKLKNIYL